MIIRNQSYYKYNYGFTLIELMIVIAIIGILAAIALPAYSKYTARAKFTEVTTAALSIKEQVELCYFDQGDLLYCNDSQSAASVGYGARGWNIKQVVASTGSTYVAPNPEVNEGTITIRSQNIVISGKGASSGFSLILEPQPQEDNSNNMALIWKINSSSTCVTVGIC